MPNEIENLINVRHYGCQSDPCFLLGIAGNCPCKDECVFDISERAREIFYENEDASTEYIKDLIKEQLPEISKYD